MLFLSNFVILITTIIIIISSYLPSVDCWQRCSKAEMKAVFWSMSVCKLSTSCCLLCSYRQTHQDCNYTSQIHTVGFCLTSVFIWSSSNLGQVSKGQGRTSCDCCKSLAARCRNSLNQQHECTEGKIHTHMHSRTDAPRWSYLISCDPKSSRKWVADSLIGPSVSRATGWNK